MRNVWSDIVNQEGLARLPQLLWVQPGDLPHQVRGKRLLQGLLVVALAGGVAALAALVGHRSMGTTSEVSWGVLIATYVFLVVSSTGAALVGSLGHVFGFRVLEPLARRAVFLSLVTLVVGFTVIGVELESPFKLLVYAVASPNFSAPIWWMGTLYGVEMVLVGAELFFLFTGDHRRAWGFGLASVVAAVAANSNLGAVFSLNNSRPFWYGPLLPVYFIATALMSGAALLILLVTLTDYFGNDRQLRPENAPVVEVLRKLLALFVVLVVFFTIWKTIAGVAGGHQGKYEVTMAALVGPLYVNFWLLEVLLGLVVPLVLLLGPWRHSWRATALGALASMLGLLVLRYDFVVQGQMFSLKPLLGHQGERFAYQPAFKGNPEGFLAYTPSLIEVLVVAGAISAAVLLFVGGLKALRVNQEVSP